MAAVPVLILAATAASAASAVVGGIAASNQAKFQASIAERNAEYAQNVARQNAKFYGELGDVNAAAAIARSRAEEASLRRDRQRRLGAMRAAYGAAGVTMEGSPLEVLGDQAMQAEEDAQLVRFAGRYDARIARLNADLLQRRELLAGQTAGYGGQVAEMAYEQQSQGALIGGFAGAGATLLGGYGSYLDAGGSNFFAPGGAPTGYGSYSWFKK